jgi:hypothetical protein
MQHSLAQARRYARETLMPSTRRERRVALCPAPKLRRRTVACCAAHGGHMPRGRAHDHLSGQLTPMHAILATLSVQQRRFKAATDVCTIARFGQIGNGGATEEARQHLGALPTQRNEFNGLVAGLRFLRVQPKGRGRRRCC